MRRVAPQLRRPAAFDSKTLAAFSPQYLQVAVPRRLFQVFTYAVPPDMPGPWAPGMRVRVPFGRGTLTGYIVSVTPQPETGGKATKIREIIARLEEKPSVSPDLLALAEWVAARYLAPLGQCLRLAFPGAPDLQRRRRRTFSGRDDRTSPALPAPVTPPLPPAVIPLRKGLLDAVIQQAHVNVLIPAPTHALLGLYGEIIQATLDAGRSALVLVPQTDQAETIQMAFTARWGARCQAYHAGLSPADRQRAWSRIQDGEVAVVIGTRSAAFAPLTKLGLIILDQEDHPAYKAENTPRYDARTVAAERARRAGAVLALASAHPSLESVHATGPSWETLVATSRSLDLPPVTVVDLREAPAGDTLSAPMIEAIAARLAGRQKVLLFLNRKGYAPVLLCRDCGQVVRCPACSAGSSGATAAFGLTFHKQAGVLRCSHCGYAGTPPDFCSACRGTRLHPSGFGTEALEEAVRTRFPEARVARLEREGAAKDRANAAILSLMQAGELDILIGTQLVVSRNPKPVASLIGLIYPDAALHLPDFRAAERAYHLLRDVMALASTDAPDAGIVIQTYVPQHHVMRALAQRDPAIFYENELRARNALGYPPFGYLIGLRVSGTKEDLVESAAAKWAALLRDANSQVTSHKSSLPLEVLGPIPASPVRLRKRFRWQLAVKGSDDVALRRTVRATVSEMESHGLAGGLRYDVDVDPQSLL